MSRLLLVRHGPSSATPPRGLLDRAGVERWRGTYDAAGLREPVAPPPALLTACGAPAVMLSSDLPRALATARALAAGRPVLATPLLREHDLPIPSWPLRAPLPAWEAVVHARWFADILRGRRAPAPLRDRVEEAARWIEAQSEEDAVVVTHGVFRWLLAHHLESTGWRRADRRRRWTHWSAWTLVRA